jgi:uncharacterized protein YegL
MKKRLSLLAAALLLSLTLFAQADKAKFYIEGQLATPTKTGQPWKLYNIRSQGITFTDKDTIYGHDTDKGVQLVFDHAATTHPQEFNCGLKFYRWQNNSGRWQIDSEVENAEAAYTQQKVMSIMLVLDCSSSIGDADFVKLKKAAKQFIDVIVDKSSDGNVHLGIVGFNSMKNTRTFDIRPLTKESRKDMFQFIDTLQLNNRTAFYYAINHGLDNIKHYVSKLRIDKDKKYDGNFVIAFTDGYDNDSFDPKIGKAAEGTEHRYFQHVNQRILKEKIGGAPIESYVLAIRGNDVDRNNTDFERVLSALSHNANENKFYSLTNFDKLQAAFEEIGTNLINKWQSIYCYIPRGYDGRVRWTIECGDVARKFFMGVSGNLGWLKYPQEYDNATHLYTRRDGGVILGAGLDMTFPITNLISVGGYVELNVSNGVGFGFTPEVAFTFPNNSAIMLGMGYRGTDRFQSNGFLLRAAYKHTGPWYFIGSYSVGYGNTVMFGVGYTVFGRKID